MDFIEGALRAFSFFVSPEHKFFTNYADYGIVCPMKLR